MKPKIFLLDLDGVVLHRKDYFSKRARVLYPDADHAEILGFFTGDLYKQIALGKRDLVETLAEILPSWKTGVGVDEFIEAWFGGENDVDQGVVGRIQEIRKSGITCVIATDHSLYRKDDIWNNLGMKDLFDGIVASADLGVTKENPAFYIKSMKILGIQDPEEIVFTDDDPKNVQAASSIGVKGVVFEGMQTLEDFNFN